MVVNQFIERVVLPPMWTTGILHENQLTDNARARAKARGVKPGVFDVYVCQAPARSVWIELKWGKNQPSEDQLEVAAALWRCGIPRDFGRCILDVLTALYAAGLKLHGNASNLAEEFQARSEAAVAKAEARATRRAA